MSRLIWVSCRNVVLMNDTVANNEQRDAIARLRAAEEQYRTAKDAARIARDARNEAIRTARRTGVHQTVLAEVIGVKRAMISNIEHGRRT